MKTETLVRLDDVYDVHYSNANTKGQWYRWFSAPKKDIEECRKWIKEYNTTFNCGMVCIPADKGLITEFRIVRMKREIVSIEKRED